MLLNNLERLAYPVSGDAPANWIEPLDQQQHLLADVA
jgi:hypothetical protein